MANRKAMSEVRKAVLRGDLPPIRTQICVDCGKPARHYDHRDYNKPLEVVPTCVSCNLLRGRALGKHDGEEPQKYNQYKIKVLKIPKEAIEALEEIAAYIVWDELIKDLLLKPGITMATLATFTNSSSTSIFRLRNKEVEEPRFSVGICLIRLHATLCIDTHDDNN